MFENTKTDLDTESPDSGHKEMSSDSLSYNLTHLDNYTPIKKEGWYSPKRRIPSTNGMASTNSNPFSTSPTVTSHNLDLNQNKNYFHDKVKIITPVPLQDASGNRLELKTVMTPKIEPPPKYKRSPRTSPKVIHYSDSNANDHVPDSDYYSSFTGSTFTRSNIITSVTPKSYNDRNDIQSNPLSKLDQNVNDLNGRTSTSSDSPTSLRNHVDSSDTHPLSISDDENTENSEDSGIPSHMMPRRLDSMTFDEFDALGS